MMICSGDKSAQDSLTVAVARDDLGNIKKALKSGADIDMKGANGQTPLMQATLGGKARAVRYLLKKGADASIGEADGYTPVHGAGFQGRAEVLRVLAEYGHDLGNVHDDGYTPIERACWGGEKRHFDTVQTFVELGVVIEGQILKTCKKSQNRETRQFVSEKAKGTEKESVSDL